MIPLDFDSLTRKSSVDNEDQCSNMIRSMYIIGLYTCRLMPRDALRIPKMFPNQRHARFIETQNRSFAPSFCASKGCVNIMSSAFVSSSML
jgi:hypothetical protein